MTRPILHQAARFAMVLLLIGAALQIGRLALGLAAMETVLEQAERGW